MSDGIFRLRISSHWLSLHGGEWKHGQPQSHDGAMRCGPLIRLADGIDTFQAVEQVMVHTDPHHQNQPVINKNQKSGSEGLTGGGIEIK
jgi:hypothetical protein